MSDQQKVSRRRAVTGAATVGALAAVAAVVPARRNATGDIAKTAEVSATAAGYRETEHVLRYYQTTRV